MYHFPGHRLLLEVERTDTVAGNVTWKNGRMEEGMTRPGWEQTAQICIILSGIFDQTIASYGEEERSTGQYNSEGGKQGSRRGAKIQPSVEKKGSRFRKTIL